MPEANRVLSMVSLIRSSVSLPVYATLPFPLFPRLATVDSDVSNLHSAVHHHFPNCSTAMDPRVTQLELLCSKIDSAFATFARDMKAAIGASSVPLHHHLVQHRDGESSESEAYAHALFKFRQTGSLMEYLAEFQWLATHTTTVGPDVLLSCFIWGLRWDVRFAVRKHKPKTTEEAIALAVEFEQKHLTLQCDAYDAEELIGIDSPTPVVLNPLGGVETIHFAAPECLIQNAPQVFDELPYRNEGVESDFSIGYHLKVADKGGGCPDLAVFSKGIGHHTELSVVNSDSTAAMDRCTYIPAQASVEELSGVIKNVTTEGEKVIARTGRWIYFKNDYYGRGYVVVESRVSALPGEKPKESVANADSTRSSSRTVGKKETVEASYEVLEKVSGASLVGRKYETLFDYFMEFSKVVFRVVADKYVTYDSGTGVVHCAPAFDEDDYRVCLENQVVNKGEDLIVAVDDDGCFTERITDFRKCYVKDADKSIIEAVEAKRRLGKSGIFTHSYPFCWRSKTPLIYRAVPSWFIRVEQLKEKLLENKKQSYWFNADFTAIQRGNQDNGSTHNFFDSKLVERMGWHIKGIASGTDRELANDQRGIVDKGGGKGASLGAFLIHVSPNEVTYEGRCLSKEARVFMFDAILQATSLLFSAFESWLVAECNKMGFEHNDEDIPHGFIFATFMPASMLGSSIASRLMAASSPKVESYMQIVFEGYLDANYSEPKHRTEREFVVGILFPCIALPTSISDFLEDKNSLKIPIPQRHTANGNVQHELHLGVLSDSTIVSTVILFDRYITDGFLPDKAIYLVDEAAARLKMETKGILSKSIVCNTLMEVLCDSNQVKEAGGLVAEMKLTGIKPAAAAFNVLMSTYGKMQSEIVEKLLVEIQDVGLKLHVNYYLCLSNVYQLSLKITGLGDEAYLKLQSIGSTCAGKFDLNGAYIIPLKLNMQYDVGHEGLGKNTEATFMLLLQCLTTS